MLRYSIKNNLKTVLRDPTTLLAILAALILEFMYGINMGYQDIFLTLLCWPPSGSVNRLGTLWPWRLSTSKDPLPRMLFLSLPLLCFHGLLKYSLIITSS